MKYAFLIILLALGADSFAQKSSNKLNFPKGQKLEMVADTKAVVTQDMMGQSMDVNINSTITRSFDIGDVKNGTATIEHKVKRVQLQFDAMGQNQNFDSDKEEDMKGEMGKAMEKSIKNKYTMTVDPTGTIVAVKADDDNPNAKADNAGGDMMSNMMSQFTEGLELPKEGDIIALQVATKGTLAKGQSWTDSVSGPESGSTKYTVTDVTASEVLIDYVVNATTVKKQDVGNGVTIDVNLKNTTTGKITVDKKTGLLKQKTIDSQGSGTMDVMGQSVPMKTKLTGTITVKGL